MRAGGGTHQNVACWSQHYMPGHQGPVLGHVPTLEATLKRLV